MDVWWKPHGRSERNEHTLLGTRMLDATPAAAAAVDGCDDGKPFINKMCVAQP